MIFRFSFNNTQGEQVTDSQEVQQLEAIRNALNPEPEETEVFPLRDIPVECDERIHDGVHPCGDPTCYCATYGYGIPSLDEL